MRVIVAPDFAEAADAVTVPPLDEDMVIVQDVGVNSKIVFCVNQFMIGFRFARHIVKQSRSTKGVSC